MSKRKFVSAILASALVISCVAATVSAYSDTENAANEVEVFTLTSLDEEPTQPYVINPSDGNEIFTEGPVDPAVGRNASIVDTVTLGKGKSKTFKFDVAGGLFGNDHNSVSVVITKTAGTEYQYIFENVTDDRTIANFSRTGNFSGTASNLDPNDKYEITIINLGTDDLTVDVSITTYIS